MLTLKKYQKHRIGIFLTLAVMMFGAMAPTQAAPAAAATAASLELSADSFLEGSPLTIRVHNVLTAGASFGISFFYDSAGTETLEAKADYANRSVQLGTSDDEWILTMTFPAPTAGQWIRVKVNDVNAGTTTVLATAQTDAVDPETLLPTDLIITVGVSLMIILVVVSIVAGLARRGSGR
jgi:hypothetical protein